MICEEKIKFVLENIGKRKDLVEEMTGLLIRGHISKGLNDIEYERGTEILNNLSNLTLTFYKFEKKYNVPSHKETYDEGMEFINRWKKELKELKR